MLALGKKRESLLLLFNTKYLYEIIDTNRPIEIFAHPVDNLLYPRFLGTFGTSSQSAKGDEEDALSQFNRFSQLEFRECDNLFGISTQTHPIPSGYNNNYLILNNL